MPKKVAEFKCDDKFNITGRGTVLTGQIISGQISTGNSIYAEGNGKPIKILDVEIGHIQKNAFAGLLIGSENNYLEYELEKLIGKVLNIID
jgi:selenocysteine-specific translation elongation factor